MCFPFWQVMYITIHYIHKSKSIRKPLRLQGNLEPILPWGELCFLYPRHPSLYNTHITGSVPLPAFPGPASFAVNSCRLLRPPNSDVSELVWSKPHSRDQMKKRSGIISKKNYKSKHVVKSLHWKYCQIDCVFNLV